jgi:hypothetical protein
VLLSTSLAEEDLLDDLALEPFGRQQQVAHAQPRALDLVEVGRADAAARGADAVAAQLRLAQLVHPHVVRHEQRRAGRDEEPVTDVEPALLQPDHLVAKGPGIDDHASAQEAAHAVMQDPRRDQVQHMLVRADVDGVAGVGAALVSQHPVDVAAEGINDLALAFVAPLPADDHAIAHGRLPVAGPGAQKNARSSHRMSSGT